jgi:hypothetical protein
VTDAPDVALAAALDELGAAPLDEFVTTRDRLARALKADGNHEAAAMLRKQRRPSLVAWSVNRIAQERRDLVEALFAAADDVRDAVEQGDGDRLRTAMRAQRTRIAELTDLAVERAASASPNPEAHRDAIGRTWEAAAADDGVRPAVTSGSLTADLRPGAVLGGPSGAVLGGPSGVVVGGPSGAGDRAPGGTAPARRSRRPSAVGSPTPSAPASTRRPLPRDELAVRRAEEALADAQRELADASAAAATADDALARATRIARRAQVDRDRAARRVARAKQTLAERRSR